MYATILLILLSSGACLAGLVETPTEGLQRLVVRGWDAQVNVTATPSKTFKINGVDDSLSPGLYIVEKKGATLEVHINEWTTKKEWAELLGQKKQRRVIEISGPSLPLEIYLRDGLVQMTRWQSEAKVTLASGKFVSVDGQGPLDVNLHHGEIQIQQQTGRLKIDQYQGAVSIKQMQGDLELVTFGSPVSIEKSKGVMSLNTQNSSVRLTQSSGTVQLDNGKGSVTLQQFQGRVEGSTMEGPVSVTLLPESEVQLRSQTGRVQIQLPAVSGAALNLLSQEGDIIVPEGKRVSRSSTERAFRGRLRGDSQKVSVSVRTVEAPIIIK